MALEKIKNFLIPGKAEDDETLYGSGQQTGTDTGGLTGEGSHLGSGNNTTTPGGVGAEHSAPHGAHGSGLTGDNTTGSSALGTGQTTHQNLTGEGSHLSSATSGTAHDQTRTGHESGVGLGQNTSSGTTSGPHTSNLANRADPRVDSDNSRGTGQSSLTGSNTGTSGLGHSSHMPGGWDDESNTPQSTGTGPSGADSSGRDMSSAGGLGSSTTGQSGLSHDTHNTGLSTGSHGNNTSSGSHLGRDAAALGTAGAIGSGIHGHPDNQHNLASTTGQSDLDPFQMGSNTGSTGTTHGTNQSSGSQSHLGRDAAALGSAGALGSAVHGQHDNTHNQSSTTGKSDLNPFTTSTGTSHGTNQSSGNQSHLGRDAAALGSAGALGSAVHDHRDNTHNQASTTGQSNLNPFQRDSNTSSTGTTHGTNQSSGSHLGRDAAAVGSAGALGSAVHSHHDNTHNQSSTTGQSGEYDPFRAVTPAANTSIGQNPLDRAGQSTHTGHTGSTQHTDTSSGSHLGRDAAAIGTAGAVGEGIHHHRENERGLGSNIGQSSGQHSTGSHGPHSTDTANLLDPSVNTRGPGLENALHHTEHGGGAEEADNQHSTKGAAFGVGSAGALGLASHEHNKHQTGQGLGSGSSGIGHSTAGNTTTGHQSSLTGSGLGNTTGTTGQGLGSGSSGLGHSTTGNATTSHQSGSGLTGSGLGNTTRTGPAPNTAGPHTKDWQNVVDPRVTPANAAQQGSTQTGTYSTTDSGSHHGRDAALVGGTGAAAYAAGSHHDSSRASGLGHLGQSDTTTGTSSNLTSGSTTGHTSGVTGQHDSTLGGSHNKDHHYGQDAALVGGTGAAAYGAGSHHDSSRESGPSHLGQSGTTTGTGSNLTSGTTTGRTSGVTGQHDSTLGGSHDKDHHYGRDAAVAGGVGGAAYEADKHHKDTKTEHQAEKDHKHAVKEAEKDHKHEEKKEHKHGILSFLHRDKSKKHTPEEEAEFDRQEREHNSHAGRNTALGGAAVGAGAYEADKHHHSGTDPNKPLPVAPGNHGIGTGAGTQNALAGNTSGTSHELGTGNTSSTGHHTGRDAALGAGAVGAAGVGAHEHDNHSGPTPLDEKPRGKDIGDHLHGARNRGVEGSSGFPGTSGFGDGQHPHAHNSEATTDQDGNPIGGGLTGTGHNTTNQTGREFPLGGAGTTGHHTGSGLTGSDRQSGSHTGRDAAALGTAGLVGEHEHRKHEGTTGHQSGLTGSHQGTAGTSDHQAHGLTRSGERSHYQSDHDQTGLQQYAERGSTAGSGLTGSHAHTGPLAGSQSMGASGVPPNSSIDQQSGLTGSQHNTTGTSGLGHSSEQSAYRSDRDQSGLQQYGEHDSGLMAGKTSDLSGRNRLHKDPPSSHPAAQAYSESGGAHGPTSGSQREGGEGLGHDTGVANAHGASSGMGANPSTNY